MTQPITIMAEPLSRFSSNDDIAASYTIVRCDLPPSLLPKLCCRATPQATW
jgi:hypothetical protein